MKNNYISCVFAAFTVLCLTHNTPITAQQDTPKTITGTVSDDSGPLIGASVVIKNTGKGTVTDLEGIYSIPAHLSDTLVFSYLGYRTREILGKLPNINRRYPHR